MDGDYTFSFTTFAAAAAGLALFFSEYIEGTSNNKAVEIFNPTGSCDQPRHAWATASRCTSTVRRTPG